VPAIEPRSSLPSSGSTWSAVSRHPAALGGVIGALLALAGLGLAGAARSSTFAGACAELARFPFPRFRVLPCPGVGTPVAASAEGARAASGSNAGSSGASNRLGSPSKHDSGGSGSLPPLPVVPRIGVVGAAVVKTPWSIVKAIVLALLAVVNALVLGIRWRVGRLQAR
jgi:hypothetical protein